MVNLSGKVALITGASSGIGAATAIHFASLGCSVAINGRNVDRLSNVSSQCLAEGLSEKQVLTVVGDISKDEEAIEVVNKTIAHFGTLDILVNNAGIGARAATLETATLEEFDMIMNTNLRSVFHMTKLCAPHLKKTQGNIVNISSVASHRAINGSHVYCASKSGLDHLTRTTARELAKDKVRVNVINPGGVETDFGENAGIPKAIRDNFKDASKKLHALERIGQPDEIAKPIAFLASDDASFITGSTLLVDGGFNLLGSEIDLK